MSETADSFKENDCDTANPLYCLLREFCAGKFSFSDMCKQCLQVFRLPSQNRGSCKIKTRFT